MTSRKAQLSEFIRRHGASIDPAQFPMETFALLSIPAYDSGKPQLVLGSGIGSPKQCVLPEDVLLSRIIPHIRRCWVVPPANGRRQIASGEWIVFRTVSLAPPYLRHFLLSDGFHHQYMRTVAGVGGSLLRARPERVARIEIPLPPIDEQKRIAAILDKADAVRRKRRQAMALTEDLLRSTFLEMFGDPTINPKGWAVEPLSELADINRGKFSPRPRNDPRYYGGIHPFIQTGDLRNCTGILRVWKQTLNEEGTRVSRCFPANTVAIAIAANIGDTAVLGFDAFCPDSVVGIQARKDVATPEYLEVFLRFKQDLLRRAAPETAQKNINLQVLRLIETPKPPLDLQLRFTEVYRRLDRLQRRAQTHLENANGLFCSLSQRAFRGEI